MCTTCPEVLRWQACHAMLLGILHNFTSRSLELSALTHRLIEYVPVVLVHGLMYGRVAARGLCLSSPSPHRTWWKYQKISERARYDWRILLCEGFHLHMYFVAYYTRQ